jgi:2-polyprenyl-6-methoxyphenol hydroxylase-like FAD-dependent oxidoreductase
MTAPILVIGAGTTGLTMACELARHGAPVRIIDKLAGINPHCRATGLHARTLEIFYDLGIVEEILSQGLKMLGMSQYADGKRFMHSSGGELDSPYPFALMLEQCKTEAALEHRLSALGVKVERETELIALAERPDSVAATIRGANGRETAVEPPWLIGCDGAHSRVRHLNRMHFSGEEDTRRYLLADVLMQTALARDEVHIFLGDAGMLLFFPLPNQRWLIAADAAEGDNARDQPTLDEVRTVVNKRGPGGISMSEPRWLTFFRINYRAASHYRHGRIFLAGDSSHIHSPFGGQGMNTGIQDAYNLAWKLALVYRGRAPLSLLDTYEKERRPIAEDILKTTRMLTEHLAAFKNISPEQRKRLYFDMVVPPEVAKRMAIHNEELDLNYSKSPICRQHEGSHFGKTRFRSGPRPGEEALDAGPLTRAADNSPATLFELMRGPRHTLLLIPGAWHQAHSWHRLIDLAQSMEARAGDLINTFFVAIEAADVPSDPRLEGRVILDPKRSLHYRYGGESECLYLIRPDGYVGYRSEPATASALHDYLGRIFL